MKKLLLILAVVFMVGCSPPSGPDPVKPWVIYDAYHSSQSQRKSGWIYYEYIDAKGNSFNFAAKYGEYQIGDTIK